MKNLYLASKNKGKIAEYKKLLAAVNCKLLLQPESLEVKEDGLTFRDNAIKKASEVSRKINNLPEKINNHKIINISKIDGVKLRINKNFWLLFRFSGTEPLLRLYCEAPKQS